jgi:transcription elongation factor GreB
VSGNIMSKAFTRESDDEGDWLQATPAATLPPGARNYMTLSGERMLREELARLAEQERPRLLALPLDEGDRKRRLAHLDQRIAHLQGSLATAVIVPPPPPPWNTVRFGATVVVREKGGAEVTYRIVGVDEMDVDRGRISWPSPLARALVNASLGDQVRFTTPAGEEALLIQSIRYEG